VTEGLYVVLGAAIGGGASLLATWQQQRHSAAREEAASARERESRRRDFQRDTLLELQQVIVDFMRVYGRMEVVRRVAFNETGVWGNGPLPEDVNEGSRERLVRVYLLVERLDNADLRESVVEYARDLVQMSLCRDEREAQSIMTLAADRYPQIQHAVGQALRQYL
jgi:hypothetical protein